MDIYYFDHAASSWPKPPAVIEAMVRNVQEYGANPGRGSHKMAVKASRILFETRHNLAKLWNIHNPNDISFALNTTAALNLAIRGILNNNDHVICTSIEHNSVRRPLEFLKRTSGIELTYVESDIYGGLELQHIEEAIRPNTKLIVVNHSSNLLGNILPIADIAEIAHKHSIKLLVDAAQTAGTFPIDVDKMGIDMLAFPGHKGLLGPQGTGGLYIHPDVELTPLILGGTGSQSESIEQPTIRPDRYESGTQNTPGIAGLNEGVKLILKGSVKQIHQSEWELVQKLMRGLNEIKGVQIYGPALGEDKTGIVAFNIEYADASEIAFILDQKFNIAVRSGYHCTPIAHQSIGTFGSGAVRASIGYYTTVEEIDFFIDSIQEIAKHYQVN